MWSAQKKIALYRSTTNTDLDMSLFGFRDDKEDITLRFVYNNERHPIKFKMNNFNMNTITHALKTKFKSLPEFFRLRYDGYKMDDYTLALLKDNDEVIIKKRIKITVRFPNKNELFFRANPEHTVKSVARWIFRRRGLKHVTIYIYHNDIRCKLNDRFDKFVKDDEDFIFLDVKYS